MAGSSRSAALVLVGLLVAAATTAAAVVIDGRLDPDYGPPLSLQTTQTFSQDNPPGFGGADSSWWSFGSELDAGYAFVSDGVLHLLLAGNVMAYLGEFDHRDELHIFLDTQAGGQNPLRGDNPDVGFVNARLNALAGLRFDSDFVPDYWLGCVVGYHAALVDAYYAEVPSGGGGNGYPLGSATAGGPGTLSGGANPFGILMTADDSNSGGVTTGCGPASGSGVTRGVEWAIPLAAIGSPTGSIKVCAMVGGNSVLGPVPPGTCGLGSPSGIDFDTIGGKQYFVIDLATVRTRGSTWGSLKAIYR